MATDLHSCTFQRFRATINRLHMLFHFTAILALLCYRISNILCRDENLPVLAWGVMTTAELIFAITWLLTQPFRWRPVIRKVFPENLPGDEELPGVDVLICTADPKKEPILEVMNTVLSAMALDYPNDKLGIYLSDDAGAALILYAMKEACSFASSWIPFCRKYKIKTRCPEAYFSPLADDERLVWSDEFKAGEISIKALYELFKKNVENAGLDDSSVHDRPSCVEVIHDNRKNGENKDCQSNMPLLVYVSREKRPSHPHRFKAGALNALLRVSGIMSNAPYIVVLDCDMYCNDPTSTRQAMCFHLEPQISSSLGFVQYPQTFYNLSKNDIYDGQGRSAYKTKWQGMDGLRGPVFTGTGYYLKKKAIYCSPNHEDEFILEPEKNFGVSSKFIASLKENNEEEINGKGFISDAILAEARALASCTYEKNTKWGKEIGYSYDSLLESTFTGYLLHCKGWRSVYLYPERPCFLGCVAIDLKDALIQQMKWSSGSFQVCISNYSPFTYGLSRMSILQSMCYGYFFFSSFCSVALLLYAIVPQLCLFTGIPLYPTISNLWFSAFAIVHISSLCQHLYEVLSTGGSLRTWKNEQRIWMMKMLTSCLFGCIDVLLKWLGITKASFRLTNKAIDQEKLKKYEKGKFDFQGAEMFMIPLKLLVLLNMVCFIIGVKRIMIEKNFGDMFGQVYLCFFILIQSYPILENLVPWKDK